MSNVKPLYDHLECPVTACFECPFAFLTSIEAFTGDKEYRCQATKRDAGDRMRLLGPERPRSHAPEWCPLKIQPVLVKYRG